MIVADTNLIASLWMPNDMEELAYGVVEKDPNWIAPFLWRSEFRNVLALYFRSEKLEFSNLVEIMREAEEKMTHKEYHVDSSRVLNLIANSFCSSYDCEFVALADEMNVSLITFDKKIIKQFPDIAVHPEQFIL